MPHQSHKRARKREKLSTHKLWPQRRTVNPQKQCAADEKAQRSVIALAARKDEHFPHAALVFNGQHTSLPNWEWRFKPATLLHARLMDDFPRQE